MFKHIEQIQIWTAVEQARFNELKCIIDLHLINLKLLF